METHHVVLHADGRDQRGAGKAIALITADLSDADGVTTVALVTDLKITGKVAQFGRGVLPELSAKMIDEFAGNLETRLTDGSNPSERFTEPAVAEISSTDLLAGAGGRRIVGAAATLGAAIVIFRWLRR